MTKSQRWRVCSEPGCPEFTQHSKCDSHRRAAEQQRGSARQRGYGREHERRFRPAVLRRDRICTCLGCTSCLLAGNSRCSRESAHADHYPQDRRALVNAGLDPNDPQYGRGLCGPCHSSHTAAEQPGGWHR